MGIFFDSNRAFSIMPKIGSRANILLNNLVSHWSLDEASGTRSDSHSSNNLTDNNTVGNNTGIISNAADFVAANSEYLDVTSNSELETGDIDFTVSFWFRADSVTGNQFLVSKENNSANRVWRVDLNGTTLRGFIFTSTNTVAANVNSSITVSTATWYHVLMWHDSSGNTLYIRVDDTTEDSAATSGTITAKSGSPFMIGAEYNSGSPNNIYDGRIDEVSFWKRLLSTGEKTDLYNSGSGRAYSYYE